MGLLGSERLRYLPGLVDRFVFWGSLVILCVMLVCCVWLMGHVRKLSSVDYPMIESLCSSERHCVAVAPYRIPIRSSRIVAFGSFSALLECIRSGPGMPFFLAECVEVGEAIEFW